jgi:hypothetical protein
MEYNWYLSSLKVRHYPIVHSLLFICFTLLTSRLFIAFIAVSLLSTVAFSQTDSTGTTSRPLSISISYFGETITHYGLSLGAQYPLHTWHRQKERRNGGLKTRDHAWVAGLHLAAYRHPRNHYGLILFPTLGYTRTKTKGAFFQTGISMGYMRVFLNGEAYRVNPEGELQRVRLASRGAFLPGVYIGWGKDLSKTMGIPLIWHVKPSLLLQVPYNTTVLPRLTLEAGIIYKLSKDKK